MAVRKIYREGGIAREFLLKRVFWISFRNSVNGCFARSLTFLFNSSLLHHIILSTFSNVQHALHSDFSTQLKGIKKHLSIADYFFPFLLFEVHHDALPIKPLSPSRMYSRIDDGIVDLIRASISRILFTPNIYININIFPMNN